ncbi:hypothetical protein F8388_001606 [Cannabis sativa]|uniref:TF-B3 domain-containing protein n=1 Tax=Cannabis sativa TaxID=3483 RepID=A0A7J6HKR0_CANSA|nr:hypothetical protein F8388_001606 [Cannabis sativa]
MACVQPHFFKIILQETLLNNKIQIPNTFWVKYCGCVSSQVILKLPCGSRWEVGLTKSSDEKVWIAKGWNKFVQDCCLSHGNLLVFGYEGNSQFNVMIFEKNTLEREYHFMPKTRDKSPPLPCSSQSHKKRKTSPYVKTEDDICGESSMPRWMEPSNISRKQMLRGTEKVEALMRANGFKSDDPFFSVLMQASFVGSSSYNMIIPFGFAKYHLLSHSKHHEDVILKVAEDERFWPVRCNYRQYNGHSQIRFESGWRAFAMDNDLKVGDVCIFVMRKNIVITSFEVTIYKNGVRNSPNLPATSVPNTTPCVKIESSFTSNYDKPSKISQEDLIPKKEIVEPSGTKDMHSPSGLSRSYKAASQYFSNNPYIQVALGWTAMHRKRLYIPLAFASLCFEKKAQTVILWVGEQNWRVNLTVTRSRSGSEYHFSGGWSAFARENCLQQNDVCIFELIQRIQPQIKVTIFRQIALPQQ